MAMFILHGEWWAREFCVGAVFQKLIGMIYMWTILQYGAGS